MKKLIITPYFGDFPPWMDKFEPPVDYDWLLDTNLEAFKKRVKDKLGIDYPAEYGSPKVWDYRCALGMLYEEELKGYDFWVTMDFDMVFGDVNGFFPDEILATLDVWSNHNTYVCGCWTIYRNCPMVNGLFMWEQSWKEYMNEAEPNGWVEGHYSRLLEGSGLRYRYSFMQGNPYNPPFNLKKENGKLYQDGIEIPMLHFRRLKIWPL